jgi:hypothetical protein
MTDYMQHRRTVFATQVPQPSYLTYFLPLNTANSLGNELDEIDVGSMLRLTMHESRTTIESGTTGLRTWPASLVLAEFLSSNPGTIPELLDEVVVDKTPCRSHPGEERVGARLRCWFTGGCRVCTSAAV